MQEDCDSVDDGHAVRVNTVPPLVQWIPRARDDVTRCAVSLDHGAFEYSSAGLRALFAQKRNLANPRFWTMLGDIRRFHATAPVHLERLEGSLQTLGYYLEAEGDGEEFRLRHLLPP